MIGSVYTADTVQEMIPQDTTSVLQQTHNEEKVNALSEQPVAKPEVTPCKEVK